MYNIKVPFNYFTTGSHENTITGFTNDIDFFYLHGLCNLSECSPRTGGLKNLVIKIQECYFLGGRK